MIRQANTGDLPRITEIYNDAILHTTATFDTMPKTPEEQEGWFIKHGSKYPVLVADMENKACGWVSISPWSDRPAYSGTVEISIYVDEAWRGKGIGSKLMKSMIEMAKELGYHTILARIVAGNPASLKLHERAGFVVAGTMREVGKKFGRLLDVILMQLIL